ncbi:MAG: MFS transporter [Myxococcota bacterium]
MWDKDQLRDGNRTRHGAALSVAWEEDFGVASFAQVVLHVGDAARRSGATMTKPSQDTWRGIAAWSCYDFANSAYATSVMATLFPILFKLYWNGPEVPAAESTFRLGVSSSAAGLAVAMLAPLLGALADRGSARKRFLAFFLAIGVTATAALYLVEEGAWGMAAACYVLSMIGFMGGNVFYDALLPVVASERRVDFVSGLGYGVGYLGGGLLLILHAAIINDYETFGFVGKGDATRACIASVALWWGLFALPLLLFVDEPSEQGGIKGLGLRSGLAELSRTFHEVRKLRHTALFLLAYWLYIDGVDTVILMATDYGLSLGFSEAALLQAFVVTQLVGFPAALVFGKVGQRLGPKTGVYVAILAYLGICTFGYFLESESQFWGLAIAVGLVQGGIQALSRSLYTRLIPASRSGEFFGFYNMLGKFAAVLGPLLVGVVSKLTGETRYGLLSLLVLFAAGAYVLSKVDVAAGQRHALEVDVSP